MAPKGSLVVVLLVPLLSLLAPNELFVSVSAKNASSLINSTTFPDGFLFGAASSAYQFEGAAHEDGKGPSIYDTFTHKFPGKILNGSNGDVALDFYHRYKGDVKLMKYIGLNAFRFSVSWPRVLPRGKLSGGVNKKGVAFYNNLINELLSNGIQPFATIFHFDLPQALEDEYGGFISPKIVDFAELCFKEFGDRVKFWATMNEPCTYASQGYDTGALAPGRCSAWLGTCPSGESRSEPYTVAHHLLLSHPEAVKLYKQKYQALQKGKIGIVLVSHWMVPYSNSKLNTEAAQRAVDFMFGWFIHPLTYGEYPKSMVRIVGKRLPKFSPKEAMAVKGSFDFLGINYYTANYASNIPLANSVNISYSTDSRANLTTTRNGLAIGDPTGVSTFFVYPRGIKDLLLYTKEKYNNPTIYITECGIGDANNSTTKEGVKDLQRITFYQRHLSAVREAMREGVKVKGFFAWSFMDNFEWNSGYTLRFGIVYIDYTDGLKRYLKYSAIWLKKFLHK